MIDREAAIRGFLPLVRTIARRLKRLVPNLDLDDLVGDGSVGLVRAVDSFDPSRGPSLQHYARRLILGAMLNGVRRMDPVSERSRRLTRHGENRRYDLAVARGTMPSLAEMERCVPGFSRAAAATHRGQPLSLDAPLPDGQSVPLDWAADPARIVEHREAQRTLDGLIARLSERQRCIVVGHYFGGLSLRAVGRRMAISPQRASQLHLSAMARLKAVVYAASR